jgi:predicted Fe-Mo cluster-binding NifX family protein
MKIAAITEDGTTISHHFGRAPYYLVVTFENGEIVQRELREKLGHSHFANQAHADEPGMPHGFGAQAHDKHTRMAETITDCEALLCQGMGAGAYYSIQQAGIRPIITDIESIDEAIQAYVDGKIVDHTEKLH